jgi:acetoin utilization deacetylase AcuC-like enzyme/GNAT superfamily N-acetyltransferase
MFRIRRIFDDSLDVDREAIQQVRGILRSQFSQVDPKEIDQLAQQLRNPLKYRFRSILFVAEEHRGRVRGFALLMHAPDLNFCYLDFISVEPGKAGGGVGGALYERVREEAATLNSTGLFFECLPDEPKLCGMSALIRQNRARLKFYERYGARPIVNTEYELPLRADDTCAPHLVYDPLGKREKLSRDDARKIVRGILERKYGAYAPPAYIDRVTESFKDDPVALRAPRYVTGEEPLSIGRVRSMERNIALVVTDLHRIHHVHERGYVESPVRVSSILKGLESMDHILDRISPQHFSERVIKEVHDGAFVEYLKRVCNRIEEGRSVYPYVFPVRNAARPPKELPIRAGYYCIDTFTPLNKQAYTAAKRAVDCALTAARAVLQGYRTAYALVRPPGHHAERRSFGGFCYFNSASVAAQYLSAHGRTAVLDIDYHHGNGTQDIFYNRADVLTVSIHGHPSFAYPYFSGFQDEKGVGNGMGFNVNLPLDEEVDGPKYREALSGALKRIVNFRPKFLVLCLGLDTAKGDPTGSWSLSPEDFQENGRMIGALRLPTLIVQEGGYRIRSLGVNARRFFLGLLHGAGHSAVVAKENSAKMR